MDAPTTPVSAGRTLAASLVFLALSSVPSSAQAPCTSQSLVGAEQADDRFGFSVALQGNNLLVGSPRDDTDGFGAGGVYRYFLDGSVARFEERWPGSFQAGSAVSIDGDWAAYDLEFGGVQTYHRVGTDWQPVPFSPTGSTAFGDALAIGAGTTPRLAVADPFASVATVRVFIYVSGISAWVEEDTLTSNAPQASFTSVVMQNGATIFAGAPSEAGGRGAVYVFSRSGSTWTQIQKIEFPQGSLGMRLGESLDADGNTLVIGAPGQGEGMVHVFRRPGGNQWFSEAGLIAPGTDDLGADVDIWSQRIVACSELTGEAVIFHRTGTLWTLEDRVPMGARANSVAFEGLEYFVGEFGSGTSEGRLHVGLLDGDDCNGNGIPDGCEIFEGEAYDQNENGVPDSCECLGTVYCSTSVNSSGNAAEIDCAGTTSISANVFDLKISGAGLEKPGLFIYGAGAINTPFGDGFRCVSSGGIGVKRVNPPAITDSTGSVVRRLDFSAPPFDSGTGMVTPGITRTFQYWFRDPMGPGGSGFNLSNGLAVTFVP